MQDEKKTKSQLIDELNLMRHRIEELEEKIDSLEMKKEQADKMFENRIERQELRTHIEFITDFDIVEAKGINISDGGISFELYEDLPFEMRFDYQGEPHHHRANLVWIKRLPFGGFRFGLMFTQPKFDIIF